VHLAQTGEPQDVPLQRAKWTATTSVTLFVEDNFGDGEEEVTRIGYVGLSGAWVKGVREGAVGVVYEAMGSKKTVGGVIEEIGRMAGV
jgi:hypothetical protein